MIKAVIDYLKNLESVVIAYSGGVDSTLLLRIAKEAGIRYQGIIIDTPLIPREEVDFALNEATKHALNCTSVKVDDSFLEMIKFNPDNRCYICKKHLFSFLVEYAKQNEFKYVLDGSNDDDKLDYRPGAVAIKELGVISPFAELGIGKQAIRDMAKELGLNNWSTPAKACLASRIAFNDEITVDKLCMIESAEGSLQKYFLELGYGNLQYRVRVHGNVARLEIPSEMFVVFMRENIRNDVSQLLKNCGFKYVALDLNGYRMGSQNEVLNQ